MITYATINVAAGKTETLTFGVFALADFCKAMSCQPDVFSLLTVLDGPTELQGIIQIVLSGLKATYASQKKPCPYDAWDAACLVETFSAEDGKAVANAFLESVLGEPLDTYLQKLEQQTAAEQARLATLTQEAREAEEAKKNSSQPQ